MTIFTKNFSIKRVDEKQSLFHCKCWVGVHVVQTQCHHIMKTSLFKTHDGAGKIQRGTVLNRPFSTRKF